MSKEKDPVNPSYYDGPLVNIQCKEIARHMGYNAGTAFAYVWRAGKKDDVQLDLDKAMWFLTDLTENTIGVPCTTPTAKAMFALIQPLRTSVRHGILQYIIEEKYDSAIRIIPKWKIRLMDAVKEGLSIEEAEERIDDEYQ